MILLLAILICCISLWLAYRRLGFVPVSRIILYKEQPDEIEQERGNEK